MAVLTFREALNQAMTEEMERDENVFLMGEEVARVRRGLQGQPGDAQAVRRRSGSSTRRSPRRASRASASARRWSGCGRSSSS